MRCGRRACWDKPGLIRAVPGYFAAGSVAYRRLSGQLKALPGAV